MSSNRRGAILSCRIPPSLKAKIEALANDNGRSITHEAERLIELGLIFHVMTNMGFASINDARSDEGK